MACGYWRLVDARLPEWQPERMRLFLSILFSISYELPFKLGSRIRVPAVVGRVAYRPNTWRKASSSWGNLNA